MTNLNGIAIQGQGAEAVLSNPGAMTGTAIQACGAAAAFYVPRESVPPYPLTDHAREDRVIQDIADLLHESTPSAETTRKVKRWIGHVLADAGNRRRWWFLEGLSRTSLSAGGDIIDLRGQLNRIASVYCPRALHKIPLDVLLRQRMVTQRDLRNNGGYPTHYALEAGHRVHLWPAPKEDTPFAVIFTRPLSLARCPSLWEGIVLNGVLGRFGRHFDRDALTQDASEFERRYERDLQRAAIDSHDIDTHSRWGEFLPDGDTPAATAANLNTATAHIVPASLTGIGFETVETGDYPITVN